ncbi:insulinase family protein, partial [Candidatus Bipolaricaulota bacterium]|nr:insulinase family protein [Candidatus Bipolaricaulota bacterium]
MAFKGTERRTALEIAQAVDALGGHLNAATANEYTSYFTTVLDHGLSAALEILQELVTSPRFSPDDLCREQVVVGEEIRTLDDDPEEVAFQLLAEELWPAGHPLGRPVIGRLDSVARIRPDDLWGFFHDWYRPERMTLVACGKVDPESLLLSAEEFGVGGKDDQTRPRFPPRPGNGVAVAEREIQQVHVALGFPTVPASSPERHGLEVLNALLGSGVSSRLFQRIREELGLVYAVFSVTSYHTDAGALAVYAATEERKLPQVLDLMWAEIQGFGRTPPDEADLARAIQRLTSTFLLGLDNPNGRMVRLGTAAALGRTPLPPDEVVRHLSAVTPDEVQELARRFLAPEKAAWAAVGPSAERLRRLMRPHVAVT